MTQCFLANTYLYHGIRQKYCVVSGFSVDISKVHFNETLLLRNWMRSLCARHIRHMAICYGLYGILYVFKLALFCLSSCDVGHVSLTHCRFSFHRFHSDKSRSARSGRHAVAVWLVRLLGPDLSIYLSDTKKKKRKSFLAANWQTGGDVCFFSRANKLIHSRLWKRWGFFRALTQPRSEVRPDKRSPVLAAPPQL